MAAGIVFLYSYFRFNTPPTTRSSTTFRRFHTAAFLYAFSFVAVWAFVTLLPPDVATRLIGEWPTDLQGVAWPFATALVFSALLPTLPGAQAFDARIRAAFHDFARVTEEADALAERLRDIGFRQDADLHAKVRSAFEEAGLDGDDAVFHPARDARAVWTRITLLKLRMDSWEERGPFRAFHRAHRAEIRSAELSYAALLPSARRRLAMLRRLDAERRDVPVHAIVSELAAELAAMCNAPTREDGLVFPVRVRRKLELIGRVDDWDAAVTLRQVIADIDAEFVQQITKLEDQLLSITARAVLHTGRLEVTRKSRLRQIGFEPVPACRDPFLDWIFLLFLGLLFSYPLVVASTPSTARQSTEERLLTGALVAIVYIVAIMAAIYPKRASFFRRGPSRPIIGYALSGVIAASAWAVVFATLWMVKLGNVEAAMAILQGRWPWVLMSFMTAFSTAWLTDNQPRRYVVLLEISGQCLTLGATAIAVVFLLRQVNPSEAALPWWSSRHIFIVVTGALTGAVLGGTVPMWWRTWRVQTTVARGNPAPHTPGVTIAPAAHSARP